METTNKELEEQITTEIKEEQKDQSVEDMKNTYKLLIAWKESENFTDIIEYCTEKASELLKKIDEELRKRKKIVAEFSQLTVDSQQRDFLQYIISVIDNSEWGNKMKEILQKYVENINSNLYSGVQVWYDVPMFTRLDCLKDMRNRYVFVQKQLDTEIETFNVKVEKPIDLHPYED